MATRNVGRRTPLFSFYLSRSFSVYLELYETFFRVPSQCLLCQFEGNAIVNLSSFDSIIFVFYPVYAEVS